MHLALQEGASLPAAPACPVASLCKRRVAYVLHRVVLLGFVCLVAWFICWGGEGGTGSCILALAGPNLQSSFLSLTHAGVTGIHHKAWLNFFFQCWGLNLGPCAC
jgi:hypothetical protein